MAKRKKGELILAERIAARLFTNFRKIKVQCLVLTDDLPELREYGGWSEIAVVSQIIDELALPKNRRLLAQSQPRARKRSK
jgi:hypothetical protein